METVTENQMEMGGTFNKIFRPNLDFDRRDSMNRQGVK